MTKPKKTTAADEREALRLLAIKSECDQIVERAAALMYAQNAPLEMIMDRILTYAAAQVFTMEGRPGAARVFRVLADKIEQGVFNSPDQPKGRQH